MRSRRRRLHRGRGSVADVARIIRRGSRTLPFAPDDFQDRHRFARGGFVEIRRGTHAARWSIPSTQALTDLSALGTRKLRKRTAKQRQNLDEMFVLTLLTQSLMSPRRPSS